MNNPRCEWCNLFMKKEVGKQHYKTDGEKFDIDYIGWRCVKCGQYYADTATHTQAPDVQSGEFPTAVVTSQGGDC